MRNCLKDGTKIELSCGLERKTFFIDKRIGEGASSIAYDAHSFDSNQARHNYRIKECMPYSGHILREGNTLIWDNVEYQQSCLQTFSNAHYRLLEMQSQELLGNQSVHVVGLYEGNNTLYSVMDVDFGGTFDKDFEETLHEILSAVLLLTKVVARLHKTGYLHLDLKPTNFIVSYEPTLMLRLFDVDSLVKISDAREGCLYETSYSGTWTSPEQSQGDFKQIGPASDVYSLGAILFSKIMGRPVENDDIGLFASWEFSGKLFEEVNPKIKRLLYNIFKKTLAASSKRRYQTAEELEIALCEAVETTAAKKPYLISNYSANTSAFLGREKELIEIHNALYTGKHAIFLHGIGGIGKSELAKKYSERYRSEYDAVLFLRYDGSLQETLNSIDIHNFEGNADEHRKCLDRLLDKHILLIIDGFDIGVDEDVYLQTVLQLKAHIIFTSRTDFSDVFDGEVCQVEVEALPTRTLEQLFMSYSGKDVLSIQEYVCLKELIGRVDGHTYFIELTARQLKASGVSLEKLDEQLMCSGLQAFEGKEKVRANKDGMIVKTNVLNAFRTLFNIAKLSALHHQVLRNLSLLQFLYVDKATYKSMTRCSAAELDALNDLLELGWLQQEILTFDWEEQIEYIGMHAIIKDLIQIDLTPSVENCIGLTNCIYYYIPRETWFSLGSVGDAEQAQASYEYSVLCRFSLGLDLHQTCNLNFVLQWMQGFLLKDDEDDDIDRGFHFWCGDNTTLLLLEKLDQVAQEVSTTQENRCCIYTIVLKGWLAQFPIIHYETDQEKRIEERNANTLKYYVMAINETEKLSCEEASVAVQLICKIVMSLVNGWPYIVLPKEIVQDVYSREPALFEKVYYGFKQANDVPLTENDEKWVNKFSESNQEYAEDEFESRSTSYCRLFNDATDKKTIVDQVIQDAFLGILQKAVIIDECLDSIFSPLERCCRNFLEEYNVEQLAEILAQQEELLFKDECESQIETDKCLYGWDDVYFQNEVRQIILFAVQGDKKAFCTYMDSLFDETTKTLEAVGCKGGVVKTGYYTMYFHSAIKGLAAVERASYTVEYLIQYANYLSKLLASSKNVQKSALYPAYDEIAHYACVAASEFSEETSEYIHYQQLAHEYQKKADEIIGAGAIFKSPSNSF